MQIDESMFRRVNHNRGKDMRRMKEQVWVFGLFDVENRKILFLKVPSRDARTLLNLKHFSSSDGDQRFITIVNLLKI